VPDPPPSLQRLGWSIAVWTPAFSEFMHEFLNRAIRNHQFITSDGKEYVMNHIFQAAIDQNLRVEHLIFDKGVVRDIGTPVELIAAQSEAAQRASEIK